MDSLVVYPVVDNNWVIPFQCVTKKKGNIVVSNAKNKLVPLRSIKIIYFAWITTSWMYGHRNITSLYNLLTTCLIILLVRVSTTFFYRYSGYNQIFIAPKDQEKTNLTCPYGTFRFKRLTFKLCNAPMTFQHCVMFIFPNMVKDNI